MELATGFDTCMLPLAHRLGSNDAPATPTALAADNNVGYSLPVFLAVLGAAALHATWNAWVHGGSNPLLHTAALVIWTGVIAAPMAMVSATRETSVLIAALLGVWLLKERLTPRQWAGAFVIVLGLIALRL
jgi:drug/metabolite transporter (DMT)-like permease